MNHSYDTECLPFTLAYPHGGTVATARCVCCGGGASWTINGRRPPPEVVHKHFVQIGWQVRKRLNCPLCSAKKPSLKEKPVNIVPKSPTLVVAPKVETTPEDAKRNKRLIVLALEDYFDEAKSQYKADHSDITIAKEFGLSVSFISAVREEFYDKLAEPDEITVLRTDISAMKLDATAFLAICAKASSRLDALCLKNGWKT